LMVLEWVVMREKCWVVSSVDWWVSKWAGELAAQKVDMTVLSLADLWASTTAAPRVYSTAAMLVHPTAVKSADSWDAHWAAKTADLRAALTACSTAAWSAPNWVAQRVCSTAAKMERPKAA